MLEESAMGQIKYISYNIKDPPFYKVDKYNV